MQNKTKKVLFIADIVGRLGRAIVKKYVPLLKAELELDLVIANAENASGGFGCAHKEYQELIAAGIDLLTSGNHIFDQKDLDFTKAEKIIRPYNYPPANPGQGYRVIKSDDFSLVVINLIGRVFVGDFDCPFRTGQALVAALKAQGHHNILVDFHAEASAEKKALALFLDGEVSALVGTHTHIPTADETMLPQGTAYITDVGMCGFYDGVLGFDKENVIQKFLLQRSRKFNAPKKGRKVFQAVVITLDASTGKAQSIERVEHLDD